MVSRGSHSMLPSVYLLIAATLWGMFWYPLRLLNESGLPGIWTSLVIYAAPMIIGGFFIWPYRHEFSRRPLLLLIMGLASGWCNVSFVIAIIEGNVVRVVMLFYLSPLWTVLLGWIFLRERLSTLSWFVLILAMAGALTMLWDPSIGMPWPQDRADWLALSSGFGFALANVIVRSMQDISIQVKTMSVWMGVVLVSIIWIVVMQEEIPDISTEVLLSSIALGVFGIILMTVLVQYGVTHMPVYRSAVILLFEIVIAAVSAELLTNEVILTREWIGGMLIIAAALESAYSQMRVKK
ncbi:MAG: DMT family transporter [Gammaproteobacteria bacterium]|nr:DMT family transporter [Gammaproteobacteria bacterium]